MDDKKRRPRFFRRKDERAARELVRDKQRLALLEPGGAASHPIDVAASPVIEARLESTPCPLCAGRLRIDEHLAPNAVLREVRVSCQLCGSKRSLWFRISTALAN